MGEVHSQRPVPRVMSSRLFVACVNAWLLHSKKGYRSGAGCYRPKRTGRALVTRTAFIVTNPQGCREGDFAGAILFLAKLVFMSAPPPTSPFDPILVASRWVCGDLLPENIAQTAVQLIEAGYEEPSVYRIAAEDKVYSRNQVEMLVHRMFSALGVPYPMSQEDAREVVARQIAREVTAGLSDPWTAAVRLDRVVPHWETNDENILAIYCITDEAEWDFGEGRVVATLEPELMSAFEQLARS